MKRVGKTVEYFLSFLLGFVDATFFQDDITMTSLALASVGLGFLTNVLIAVVTYLFVYVILRAINSIANAFGQGSQNVALSLTNVSRAILSGKQEAVEENLSGS